MTTTNTPAKPRPEAGAAAPRRRLPAAPYEPAPEETGRSTPRVRGRHRKPRRRKVLLAVGCLALAAGTLSLVRLTSGPGSDSVGTVEAGPRPDPVTTGTDQATATTATAPTAPEVSPSSPAALGGAAASPVTKGARPALPATTGPRSASPTPGAPSAAAPAPTTVPDTPNTPEPTASDDAPRPAPGRPAPPSRTAPAPPPKPEQPEQPQQPDDPRLCVPIIGVCVDSPLADR